MKRLSPLAPHARLSQNPLFNLEVRRIRWGISEKRLWQYSTRRLAVACVVALPLWLLLSFRSGTASGVDDVVLLLVAASFLAGAALDYASMSAALGSINGELSARRWELLRLTPLTGRQIVAAKHGVAQARAWRWMILLVALRLAVMLICGLSAVLTLFQPYGWGYLLPSQKVATVIGLAFLTLAGVIFIIEPFWRMRSVTALGVAISARARQQSSSVLAAVGSVFVLWVGQAILLLSLALAGASIFSWFAFMEAAALQFVICSPTALLLLIFFAVYGFYAIVLTWSLRRAERWITRSE